MRVRTWSACVALAWGIVLIMTAAGPFGSLGPAQATTRNAGITSNTSTISTISTNIIQATLTTTATRLGLRHQAQPPAAADRSAAGPTAPARAGRYVVRPGDTLSGIAAATGVQGGWPALYAANRAAIGPSPSLIRPGTTLVLPGRAEPQRYTVQAGDTLSGIAAAAGVQGGWPALYAANRAAVGPDPDVLRTGISLVIPRPTPTVSPTSGPAHPAPTTSAPPSPTSSPATRLTSPTAPTPSLTRPATAPATAPASTSSRRPAPPERGPHSRPAPASTTPGLPRWLIIVLAVAGLLIATAFLTEPALALARRLRARRGHASGHRMAHRSQHDEHIVLADFERLVVTHSRRDGTVYVLRPPDADPHSILLAARLVLAQDRYEALAGRLGVPAHWPAE